MTAKHDGRARIYEFSATMLDGTPASLARWRGDVLLVVNTASRCGFTPQFAGLETLQSRYAGRGFSVLGFPCNQFGNQEPGDAATIGGFCQKNYGVSFPMFAKVDVNGGRAHALFAWLKAQKSGMLGLPGIKWNFTKFLIDRRGEVVARYAPTTKPDALAKPIEVLL